MADVTTAPAPYLKPLPQISDLNRPFWDGVRAQEFRVPRCRDCGDYNWLPYPACRSCLSERQIWTVVSGDATVFSFTVVHRGPGAFNADVPYVLALGQLIEAPRKCNVLATLVGADPDEVHIDMPIKIGYVDIPSEGITMYQWVPR
jgi:uncharacterized OB-fold protein